MSDALWIACALVLIIEGIGPMLFPNRWRMYIVQLVQQPSNNLRRIGGAMVTIGLVTLIYLL